MIQSAEELVRLRSSERKEEYDRAAHEEAPLRVWLDVIERYPAMRQWVAHNKTVPTRVLEILSRDPDRDVRFAVTSRRKLTEELHLRLAGDSDESVRERIAWNAKATMRALEQLATDSNASIREKAKARLAAADFVSPTRHPCPCCDWLTLTGKPPGTYEVCPVCFWEDDPVQFRNADYRGGANKVSLNEARANYGSFGAASKADRERVRAPTEQERARAPGRKA